jgi:hypothetical protein
VIEFPDLQIDEDEALKGMVIEDQVDVIVVPAYRYPLLARDERKAPAELKQE